MDKYSKAEIKRRALIALQARDAGDSGWLQLCMSMMVATGLDYEAVNSRIEALAK